MSQFEVPAVAVEIGDRLEDGRIVVGVSTVKEEGIAVRALALAWTLTGPISETRVAYMTDLLTVQRDQS